MDINTAILNYSIPCIVINIFTNTSQMFLDWRFEELTVGSSRVKMRRISAGVCRYVCINTCTHTGTHVMHASVSKTTY